MAISPSPPITIPAMSAPVNAIGADVEEGEVFTAVAVVGDVAVEVIGEVTTVGLVTIGGGG
jgi:hypothetical protein